MQTSVVHQGLGVIRERVATATRPVRRRLGLIRIPHDRYLLERIIFPALCSRAKMARILFVGCDNYTEHYEGFFEGRDFITIDVDPRKARYGATRHVIDSVLNLDAHFPAESLDAVICNGVIGWGLNEPREIRLAAAAVFRCLRGGGVFIIGWDDVPGHRPLMAEAPIESGDFVPFPLPPFRGSVYHAGTELQHVYNFYLKPGRGEVEPER